MSSINVRVYFYDVHIEVVRNNVLNEVDSGIRPEKEAYLLCIRVCVPNVVSTTVVSTVLIHAVELFDYIRGLEAVKRNSEVLMKGVRVGVIVVLVKNVQDTL